MIKRALIVVDVQNDFISGSLAVEGGAEVVPILNQHIAEFNQAGDLVFYSMDSHPQKHCSFKENGGSWPPHCVMGTEGQRLHPDLIAPIDKTLIVSKGFDKRKDAYSAFDGTSLESMLTMHRVSELWIGGLATDYCVKATVLDALRLHFETVLLEDACRAVAKKSGEEAVVEMLTAGVTILHGFEPKENPAGAGLDPVGSAD